jgi:DNA-binding response OmpR family regulator
MDTRILIVDDEEVMCDMVSDFLEQFGHRSDMAGSVKPALKLMESRDYDIVLTDKNMPDADGTMGGGMEILRFAKTNLPDTAVLMMTGYATIETAIEAMKLGAFDYIVKPFSVRDLKERIDRALEYRSFINPASTLHIYKSLHDSILNLVEDRRCLSAEGLHETLRAVDEKIDHFFKAQKEWERAIILQREALATIAGCAEVLRESIPETDATFPLVERICLESGKRL